MRNLSQDFIRTLALTDGKTDSRLVRSRISHLTLIFSWNIVENKIIVETKNCKVHVFKEMHKHYEISTVDLKFTDEVSRFRIFLWPS